ncbi:hypothetical protein [Ferrimicrobium sp.]|uniref:hypothetical protein n=1 Tax=Ferrimicrobium sp. TaxID=2926050 RepID=UPI00260380D8|nr:hypothetical protein [Ferrimicrobium sp.]
MSKNSDQESHRLRSRVVVLAIGTCVSAGALATYVGLTDDTVRPQAVTHSHRASSDVLPTQPASSVPFGEAGAVVQEAEGKLPSLSADVAQMTARGISVSDGKYTDSALGIGQMMRGFEVNALVSRFGQELRTSPSMSVSTIEATVVNSIEQSSRSYSLQAVASATLYVMLLRYAAETNQMVPYSTALRVAQKNYQDYLAAGSPPLSLPNGETAKQSFISPGAIHLLRDTLTTTELRNKIGGDQYALKGIHNQHAALAAWMTKHLDSLHPVVVNSPVQIAQLPNDLPPLM